MRSGCIHMAVYSAAIGREPSTPVYVRYLVTAQLGGSAEMATPASLQNQGTSQDWVYF